MSASSLSVAAAPTSISAASSSSSSAAACSADHLSVTSIQFPLKIAKPFKFLKLNPHYHLYSCPLSLLSRSHIVFASAAFDGVEGSQSLELFEEATESPEEGEEYQGEEDEGNYEAFGSQSAEARRLYVGNLPFSLTSSQLEDVFAEAGTVASVEIVYNRVTGRSRGFAFVTMGSVEEAKEAIRLFDGSQVGGRTVKVNLPEVPRGGEREVMGPKIRSSNQSFVDSPHKIYAGNLSWSLTSEGLKEAFEDQPGFLSAKIIYERNTGRSRGFGFVTFASAEEVETALRAMNEVEVEGRPLRLNLAEQRPSISLAPGQEMNPQTETDISERFTEVSS